MPCPLRSTNEKASSWGSSFRSGNHFRIQRDVTRTAGLATPESTSTAKSIFRQNRRKASRHGPKKRLKTSHAKRSPDAMRLEIFKNIFHSIAEEMGAALRRSAFSPNIKERRDYSCAVYDANGQVLAMGDHMPVHLGSMPASVAAARAALHFEAGDIALLNDPFAGGTHLPDLTLVMPVFVKAKSAPQFFIASRAHHADIGGALAGSMGPATEIFQEGLRIPPVKIFRKWTN